jgi:Protein of unknown function (DUF3551)
MRKLLAAAVVLVGLTLMSSQPAQAFPARHAFCLQGDVYPGWSFCNFDTYAQCWATAAGINAACVANPFYGAQSGDPYAYRNRPRPHPPGRYAPSSYPPGSYSPDPYPAPQQGYYPR